MNRTPYELYKAKLKAIQADHLAKVGKPKTKKRKSRRRKEHESVDSANMAHLRAIESEMKS